MSTKPPPPPQSESFNAPGFRTISVPSIAPHTQPMDPLLFGKMFWPDTEFYDKQREIIYSFRDNVETFVPAGNMLGKDFVSAFLCLWFVMTRHPVRLVSTSADHNQLESVLWGEIRRFLQNAVVPLDVTKGGPLIINHLHIRKIWQNRPCGLSYLIGRVAAKGEGMLGHHIAETGDGIPRTAFLGDEGSGIEDITYERATTWARRILIIGNPYPGAPGCTFFEKNCKAGDLLYSDSIPNSPSSPSPSPSPSSSSPT